MKLRRRKKIAEKGNASAQVIARIVYSNLEFITCALDNVKLVLYICVDHFCSTLSQKYFLLCYKSIETMQIFHAVVWVQHSFILGPNEKLS